MERLLIAFTFLIGGFIHSQNIDSLKIRQLQKEIDSIEYSAKDFDIFKKGLTKNKNVLNTLSKKAALESGTELDLLELIELSFEDAKIKYGEKNVKMMIYFYNKSSEVLEKFRKLDSEFQLQIDSLKIRRAFFEKEIDSLRKN